MKNAPKNYASSLNIKTAAERREPTPSLLNNNEAGAEMYEYVLFIYLPTYFRVSISNNEIIHTLHTFTLSPPSNTSLHSLLSLPPSELDGAGRERASNSGGAGQDG